MTDFTLQSIAVRVALSLLVGGILGIERGWKSRPAGFRTHMLVCLGACLVMMTNIYVYSKYGVSDPVRMGAQVVSGIGFLGAGTIIVTGNNHIKGITTAAGLWAGACCGLAIGAGFYEGALLGAVSVLLILTVMQKFDRCLHRNARYIDIYVELKENGDFTKFFEFLRGHDYEISEIQFSKSKVEEAVCCASLSLKSKERKSHVQMLSEIAEFEKIGYLSEIK